MPVTYPQLEHPPIVEAIFTLTFEEPVPIADFRACIGHAVFSGWENQDEHEFSVVAPPTPAPEEDQKIAAVETTTQRIGFFLKKPDGFRILRIRQGELSFHVVGQYPSGDTMLAELQEGVQAIVSVAGDLRVAGTSARYVNQIRRPDDPSERIRDVFSVWPQLPENLGKQLHGFFQHLAFPSEDEKLHARVVQTIIPPTPPEGARIFVLDINVVSPQPCGSDLTQVWTCFQNLRDFKNKIFKSFLTDTLYQSFNPQHP